MDLFNFAGVRGVALDALTPWLAARVGAATVLEREAGENAFRGAIEEYVTNRTLRRKRCDRGRELVDGRGTERVYPELLSLLDEK